MRTLWFKLVYMYNPVFNFMLNYFCLISFRHACVWAIWCWRCLTSPISIIWVTPSSASPTFYCTLVWMSLTCTSQTMPTLRGQTWKVPPFSSLSLEYSTALVWYVCFWNCLLFVRILACALWKNILENDKVENTGLPHHLENTVLRGFSYGLG